MRDIFLSNPGKTYLGLGHMPSLKPVILQEVEEDGGYFNRSPVMSTPQDISTSSGGRSRGQFIFFQKDHMIT